MNQFKFFAKAVMIAAFVFAVNTASEARTIVIKTKPPRVKVVVRPHRPYAKAVWMRGRWAWKRNSYVWVNGYWTKPRHGFVWVPGYWRNVPGGNVWIKGHWRRV